MAIDLNEPSVAIRIHRSDVVDGHVAEMPTIAASITAFAVVRRTRNMTYGLLAGFPVLWLLHALTLL